MDKCSNWNKGIFKEYIDLIHGYQFRDYDFTETGCPIIKIGQINKSGKLQLANCSFFSKEREASFSQFKINNGDVLMALTGATLGKTCIVYGIDFTLYQNYRVGRFEPKDKEILHKPFIYYYLSSHILLNQVFNRVNEGAQGNIGKADFDKTIIEIPPLIEQQKIAEVLTTIDNVIEKTEQLIEKLKSIKKGLMQDLFTRGVTSDGKLRPTPENAPELYKESELGWIPKEWEVVRLGEATTFLDGRRIPIKEEYRGSMKGDIPYYGASGIIDWVNDFIFDDDLILLGEDGENLLSRVLPLAFKISGKTWVNNHAHVIKPNNDMDIDYLTEYLENTNYDKYISGSAQPKLNQSTCVKILILKPPKSEQEIIADFIIANIKQLQHYMQLLYKHKLIKKGLMDDLLTGNVRVNSLIDIE